VVEVIAAPVTCCIKPVGYYNPYVIGYTPMGGPGGKFGDINPPFIGAAPPPLIYIGDIGWPNIICCCVSTIIPY
jgi:hypothetical protein